MTVRVPLRPIETHYKGHRFRRRLEARWAVAFDVLRLDYDYEPEGYRLANGLMYLPDFYLSQVRMFAEVKPEPVSRYAMFDHEAMHKASGLVLATGRPLIILDGAPKDMNYWAMQPEDADPVGWDWLSFYPFEPHAMHVSQGRFWSDSDGIEFPYRVKPEWSSVLHPAIEASRSARFERGQ